MLGAQQGVEHEVNGSPEALLHGCLHIIWETEVGKITFLAWAVVLGGMVFPDLHSMGVAGGKKISLCNSRH